ncbi:MAG: galactose oxidase-like domain-containing protein, partial [Actinomycetota bacterium]
PFDVGVIAVHSVLLPDGRVLMVSRPRAGKPTKARVWNPSTGTSIDVTPADASRDLYCAGHSLLDSGLAFYAGGNRLLNEKDGVADTDIFDPLTQDWDAGPLMSQARWYPTNVVIPNGKVLIFGGWISAGNWSNTVNEYNPGTNSMIQRPASATLKVGLYPRMHVLTNGKLFHSSVTTNKLGSLSRTFNPPTNTWSAGDSLNFGARADGISVQLPDLDEILVFGGSLKNNTPATSTAEVIDTSDANPQWRYTSPMNEARKEGNSVVLPDGTVLVIGGAAGPGSYENPVLQAEVFDPEDETWTPLASQQAARTHHSTALLLPDGRVLSAGGDRGDFQTKAEIFSPPYLFKGPRPLITTAPGAVDYGETFDLTSPSAADIASVSLIKPGSVTHSTSFDQRFLDLEYTRVGQALQVSAPPSAAHAPPGDYMLFIVNSAGVPSVAKWIHVG